MGKAFTTHSKRRAPLWIFFDAAGTLIHVRDSVANTYALVGEKLGIVVSSNTIGQRIPLAWQTIFGDTTNPTNDNDQRERWFQFVAACFAEASPAQHIVLFKALWDHFSSRDAWRWETSIATMLGRLKEQGYRLAIASNFDRRLPGLIRSIPALDSIEVIFHSADVGWSKPNRQFFRTIEDRLNISPDQCLLIGDTPENDYFGPIRAGWTGVLLDPDCKAEASVATRIPTLEDLPTLLESDFGQRDVSVAKPK